MNQTIKQMRTLKEARIRQKAVKKRLQQDWTRVIDRTPDDFEEAECNMPRFIPREES